jgi:hypothetical protein
VSVRKAENGFAFLIASRRVGMAADFVSAGGRSCRENSCTAGAADAIRRRAHVRSPLPRRAEIRPPLPRNDILKDIK